MTKQFFGKPFRLFNLLYSITYHSINNAKMHAVEMRVYINQSLQFKSLHESLSDPTRFDDLSTFDFTYSHGRAFLPSAITFFLLSPSFFFHFFTLPHTLNIHSPTPHSTFYLLFTPLNSCSVCYIISLYTYILLSRFLFMK